MNIKEPFHGNLFYRYSSKNINLLNSKNFFEPYVEPEISFRIKDDINISKAPFKFKDLDYLLDGLFCSIEIVDLMGDKNHYSATIKSKLFNNLNKIEQHKLVYKSLKGKMGNELHALSLTTEGK